MTWATWRRMTVCNMETDDSAAGEHKAVQEAPSPQLLWRWGLTACTHFSISLVTVANVSSSILYAIVGALSHTCCTCLPVSMLAQANTHTHTHTYTHTHIHTHSQNRNTQHTTHTCTHAHTHTIHAPAATATGLVPMRMSRMHVPKGMAASDYISTLWG